MLKLKTVKLIALVFVAFSLILISSCGDDGGDGPTDQEVLIELLNGNTFSTTNASTTSAVGVDVANVDVLFSGNATMNFTVSGGEIEENAVSGGSFSIAENGTLSNLTVTAAAENIEVTAGDAAYNSTAGTVTVSFSTAEAPDSRTSGIGSFNLVFDVGTD